nr:sigma factor [Salinispora pacifica]
MERPSSFPDFEDFVRGSGRRLLRFAILMCGDPSHAEAVLQTVLEQTYPRWNRLRDGDPERYVRRAIANRVISRWRSPGSADALRRCRAAEALGCSVGAVKSQQEPRP